MRRILSFFMITMLSLSLAGCGLTKTDNTEVSEKPQVILPSGIDGEVTVAESSVNAPGTINNNYAPIGKVYDIKIEGEEKSNFGKKFATLIFKYDREKLEEAKFAEDFSVNYFDEEKNAWLAVDKIEVDYENSTVTAYTSHFTPFVITAIPLQSGTFSTTPPAGISQDFPSGIAGSGNAIFSVIDENLRVYQDVYSSRIKSVTASVENSRTFAALGLKQALGVATKLGKYSDNSIYSHGLFTGEDYIIFTAHKDIDIYLMYDAQGGGDKFNTSRDAAWLALQGFSTDINGNKYFLETERGALYAVYKKSYNKGEEVRLHGNRNATTEWRIQNNYFLAIKRRGVTIEEPTSALCVLNNDITPPANVTNLQGFGSNSQVRITWQNPSDLDFTGVIIRMSTIAPPAHITDGNDAIGREYSSQSYRVTDLTVGVTYYYTIFAIDENNNHYKSGASIAVTPAIDSDNDGLSNEYEDTTIYSTGQKTDPANLNTDGDGYPDGLELSLGTDPTNPDDKKPVIGNFSLSSNSVTVNPNVSFSLAASDNKAVTGYMITKTGEQPLSNNDNWQGVLPVSYTIPSEKGTYTLYAWVKDAAGNVNDAAAPITVQLISDIIAPVPGNNGLIVQSGQTQTSVHLSWSKATDNESLQPDLQYQVYLSTSSNFNTVESIELNGTVVTPWTADLSSANVYGLSVNSRYYFNVIVRDQTGNKTAYQAAKSEIINPIYWSKMENLLNITTNAEIALTGTPVYYDLQNTFEAGKLGSALVLYNTAPDSAGTFSSSGTIYPLGLTNRDLSRGTISAWVMMSGSDNNANEIKFAPFNLSFNDTGSTLAVSYSFSSSNGTFSLTPSYKWYHLYMTWDADGNLNDGKTLKIYVDGVLRLSSSSPLTDLNSSNLSVNLKSTTIVTMIGTYVPRTCIGGGSGPFGISIPSFCYGGFTMYNPQKNIGRSHLDNLKVWEIALDSPEDIAKEWNGGIGRE